MDEKSRLKNKGHQQPQTQQFLLDIIDAVGFGIDRFYDAKFGPRHEIGRLSSKAWTKLITDKKKKRALKEMRRKKWIRDRKQGEDVVIQLNHAAIVAALKSRIAHETLLLPDGKCFLVLFDFPNGANKARASWRYFLYKTGFEKVQLSSFATNKDVIKPISALIHVLGIKPWIKVFICEEIILEA